MKYIILLLLLISCVVGLSVEPKIRAIKETGNEKLPSINSTLKIDCDNKIIYLGAHNITEPIKDATTYLFYTNYGYDLLSTSKTDQMGISKIVLSGNKNFLTALFIIRIDANGFRSKEMEFTFEKCFSTQETSINQTQPNVPQNNSTINENQINPQENKTIVESPKTPQPNSSQTTESQPNSNCLGLLIIGLIFMKMGSL